MTLFSQSNSKALFWGFIKKVALPRSAKAQHVHLKGRVCNASEITENTDNVISDFNGLSWHVKCETFTVVRQWKASHERNVAAELRFCRYTSEQTAFILEPHYVGQTRPESGCEWTTAPCFVISKQISTNTFIPAIKHVGGWPRTLYTKVFWTQIWSL